MSSVDTFSKALKEARILLERGGFREAFSRIINATTNRLDHLFEKLALISDAGVALRDIGIIEYCVYLMEHHEKEILSVPTYTALYWFNLANLRANILVLRESKGVQRCWYDRSITAPARISYKKAAEAVTDNKELKSRIYTAHAHLLTGLGRAREAFELFDKAIHLDGNANDAALGRIETLVNISGTAPSLEKNLLREAKQNLNRLKTQDGGLGWNIGIENVKKCIDERLGSSDDQEIDFPRNTIFTQSDRAHNIVSYSLQNRLFLSPCSGCQRCDRAIGDTSTLGTIHAVIGGKIADRYHRTTGLLGRIIERYQVLRTTLIDHCYDTKRKNEDDIIFPTATMEGWQALPSKTVILLSALAGAPVILEGMATCVALYLGYEPSPPVQIQQIFGTVQDPAPHLKKVQNPALHGFWDLWADGMDNFFPGIKPIWILGNSLSSPDVETFSTNDQQLRTNALSFIQWLGLLISYIISFFDRDARGETETPSLWPLQAFIGLT